MKLDEAISILLEDAGKTVSRTKGLSTDSILKWAKKYCYKELGIANRDMLVGPTFNENGVIYLQYAVEDDEDNFVFINSTCTKGFVAEGGWSEWSQTPDAIQVDDITDPSIVTDFLINRFGHTLREMAAGGDTEWLGDLNDTLEDILKDKDKKCFRIDYITSFDCTWSSVVYANSEEEAIELFKKSKPSVKIVKVQISEDYDDSSERKTIKKNGPEDEVIDLVRNLFDISSGIIWKMDVEKNKHGVWVIPYGSNGNAMDNYPTGHIFFNSSLKKAFAVENCENSSGISDEDLPVPLCIRKYPEDGDDADWEDPSKVTEGMINKHGNTIAEIKAGNYGWKGKVDDDYVPDEEEDDDDEE